MAIAEIEEYRHFTKPAELHKAINTLKGIVAGITMEGGTSAAEMEELMNWCTLHQHLIDRHPFSELIPMIRTAQEDGVVSEDEAQDILWLCNNFVVNNEYYDVTTSAMQYLSGMLHGMLADNELADREISVLRDWLDAHEFLKGSYPFDEIDSLIVASSADGVIDEKERQEMKAFFSNFIDMSMSINLNQLELEELQKTYSIDGICAVCPEIEFKGKTFCFTGQSYKSTRNEIAEIVVNKGANFSKNITQKVDYLIIGNAGNPCWAYSCYGRKVEQAVNFRKTGHNIVIVNETDFWDSI